MLGVERERRKGEGPSRAPAGVRTFALVGLLGGLVDRVGGAGLMAVAAAFVAALVLMGYRASDDRDPGITTEVALVITFLLGVLAQRDPGLAAAIGVAVALVLAYRDRVHRLVRDTLSEEEIHDALLFAAAAVVVLPLIPNEPIGPNDSFNPQLVWRLVVIVMAVQAAGYVALRAIGPRYGLLVTGFVSGFVSSTATVGAMGSRAVAEPKLLRAAVGAAVVSTVATVVLLAIVLVATSAEVMREMIVPLAFAAVAAVGYSALVARRLARAPLPSEVDPGRAFDLRSAALLAVLISAVLLVAAVLNSALGSRGVTLTAAIAGFGDSQSAAASASSLVAVGKISAAEAVIPVMAALTTNTISKAIVAYTIGRRRYATEVWIGLALFIGAAWAGWALTELAG